LNAASTREEAQALLDLQAQLKASKAAREEEQKQERIRSDMVDPSREIDLPSSLVDQLDQEREYYDNSKALAEDAANFVAEQEARKTQARIAALNSASSVFGSLSDIVSKTSGEQSDAFQALFALSKGFAVANASLNLYSAISQALADPTALTPAQKFANYAAIASAAGGLVSSIQGISFDGARRQGGQVVGGNQYLVGEDGPEVVSMGGNGRVTPFNQLMKEAGGAQSTPNFKTEIYNMANGVEVKSKQPRWSNEDKAWVLGVVVESLDQRRDVFKGIERNTTATGKAR